MAFLAPKLRNGRFRGCCYGWQGFWTNVVWSELVQGQVFAPHALSNNVGRQLIFDGCDLIFDPKLLFLQPTNQKLIGRAARFERHDFFIQLTMFGSEPHEFFAKFTIVLTLHIVSSGSASSSTAGQERLYLPLLAGPQGSWPLLF
jgi:hypothetical protein